jgi:hypothetical protein
MTRMHMTLGLGVILAAQAACGLLDTNTPDIIDPGDLNSPEGAQAKRSGAVADFILAKDGDSDPDTSATDGQIILSGLLADEFVLSTTPPSEQEVDQRAMNTINPTITGMYFQLHKARAAAENAVTALQRFSTDGVDDAGIPEMWALAGYTYIYFAENFCSAVPYSSVAEGKVVPGASETTDQTLDRAIARFDSALALSSIDAEITNLAHMGRARALLDKGLFAQAAAEVAAVPTDFAYYTEHAASPSRLQNALYIYSSGFLISVSDSEGGAGLPYRTPADPRIPFIDEGGPGLDNTTPQFTLTKFPDATAPVPVSDGIEARLIQAEGFLQGNDFQQMTDTLNGLRATFQPTLPTLAVPADRAAAEDLLFSERAFWLFATGHRLGDMRRLLRQYGRAANGVFPTGNYLKGGAYGDDVNIPVPVEEQINPNFDRAQCVTTTP